MRDVPANVELVAVLAGAACVAGLILAVVAIVGTSRPPGPAPGAGRGLDRLWKGSGTTGREQRAHQALLTGAVLGGALAFLITGLPVVGLLVAVAVPGTPWLFSVGKSEQRAIARIEAVGEWTRRLKDVSATGQGLQAAITGTVATAPEEIQEEVRLLAARLQAGWLPPRTARLATRSATRSATIRRRAYLHSTTWSTPRRVLGSIAGAAPARSPSPPRGRGETAPTRFAARSHRNDPGHHRVRLITCVRPPYGTPLGRSMMRARAAFIALLAWCCVSQPQRLPASALPGPPGAVGLSSPQLQLGPRVSGGAASVGLSPSCGAGAGTPALGPACAAAPAAASLRRPRQRATAGSRLPDGCDAAPQPQAVDVPRRNALSIAALRPDRLATVPPGGLLAVASAAGGRTCAGSSVLALVSRSPPHRRCWSRPTGPGRVPCPPSALSDLWRARSRGPRPGAVLVAAADVCDVWVLTASAGTADAQMQMHFPCYECATPPDDRHSSWRRGRDHASAVSEGGRCTRRCARRALAAGPIPPTT